MRLFEVLGGWVATVPELDVKMVLGRHTLSPRLAQRAVAQAAARAARDEPRPADAARRTTRSSTFMDAVREPEAPEHTIEKLVGVYRVLIPRFIAAYTFHLQRARARSPTRRRSARSSSRCRTSSTTGATARC